MLEELRGDPGEITLIHRVVNEHDCVLKDELAAIARTTGATVHHLVGDHRDPGAAHFLSPVHLLELVPDLRASDVFLCGPPVMMDVTRRNLTAAGVPAEQIYSERFALAA
jgi:ferredoxin-NADP reductase